jgi:hypothetical protein
VSTFRLLFQIAPPAVFGLPDGTTTVIPGSAEPRQFAGPTLDTRTGLFVAHGTLSEYRKPHEALAVPSLELGPCSAKLRDNFLDLTVEAADARQATKVVLPHVDSLLQGMSVLFGQLFSASLLLVEDEAGEPQDIRLSLRRLELFKATVYNIDELASKFETAATWAKYGDDATRKALFYSEHAALLSQFADTLPSDSPHAAFSHAMAFLQLFKALTTLLGDPSVDRDYQSRFRRLGLPPDYWNHRAKPLYKVRNDDDVAHYSREMPDAQTFREQYGAAMSVFREALEAHIRLLRASGSEG